MRVVLRTGGLFWEKDLRDFLTLKRQALFEEIYSIDADRLLTPPLEDLCDQLIEKYTVATPQIDESGIASESRDAKIDLRTRGRYHIYDPDRPVYRDGTRYTVLVPFTGNPELFECRPFTATGVMPPRAVVRGNELAFAYELLPEEEDLLEEKLNRDLASLKAHLGGIAHDLDAFNSSIREFVRPRIRARQRRLLHARESAVRLGFPARARSNPDAQPSSVLPRFPHADDYSWVCLVDGKLCLTPYPANAVKFIHEECERTRDLDVSEKLALKASGSQQQSLYEVLRYCKAWSRLVVRGTKTGTVRLNVSNLGKIP